MDDKTRKVLRRACSQYFTGIRKPFVVGNRTHKLEASTSYDETGSSIPCTVLMTYNDGISSFADSSCSYITAPLTPEAIFEVIQLQLVAEVMES